LVIGHLPLDFILEIRSHLFGSFFKAALAYSYQKPKIHSKQLAAIKWNSGSLFSLLIMIGTLKLPSK